MMRIISTAAYVEDLIGFFKPWSVQKIRRRRRL